MFAYLGMKRSTAYAIAMAAGFGAAGFGTLALFTTPASALSMAACSVKYKAAKKAGTLAGKTWNDFRKTECGAAPTTTKTAKAKTTTKKPTLTVPKLFSAKPTGVTFPSTVSPKYASEKPSKARMHTCLDNYKINKANKTLAGLKWIEKGGGYYSICNRGLKKG